LKYSLLFFLLLFLLLCGVSSLQSQDKTPTSAPSPSSAGPKDPKAQKTYDSALKKLKDRRNYSSEEMMYLDVLDAFRKADKQDGGQCITCKEKTYIYAMLTGDYKLAEQTAEQLTPLLHAQADKIQVLRMIARACIAIGQKQKGEKEIQAAHQLLKAELDARPDSLDLIYMDGKLLAFLKQDDASSARFKEFLQRAPKSDTDYTRAQRYIERPELARSLMVPNFRFKTIDGKEVSLDDLTGKVVLLDFWATWCGPCVAFLPTVKDISRRYSSQPFVVISVSLDRDEDKWRSFVSKNEMTWLQTRDGFWDGALAKTFHVKAIPQTFTIDSDGVLQSHSIGDSDLDGVIRKQLSRASKQAAKRAQQESGL
jgi:thiol-disulfide isomerase/thioredoxin